MGLAPTTSTSYPPPQEARFGDSFNDVRGRQSIAGIFQHMFDTTQQPVFHVRGAQTDGSTAWGNWTFDFRLRGNEVSTDGVTHLDFGADGRVVEHRDRWDAADLFVEFPLLGTIVIWVISRRRAPGSGKVEQQTVS